MQQAMSYRERSRDFLAKAYAELGEDLGQASEKGWGAAAEIVKAIAEERGWTHQNHRGLYEVVSRLGHETGDPELIRLFSIAGSLHTNFYESWFTREYVESGIQDVQQFIEKVEPLLSASP